MVRRPSKKKTLTGIEEKPHLSAHSVLHVAPLGSVGPVPLPGDHELRLVWKPKVELKLCTTEKDLQYAHLRRGKSTAPRQVGSSPHTKRLHAAPHSDKKAIVPNAQGVRGGASQIADMRT